MTGNNSLKLLGAVLDGGIFSGAYYLLVMLQFVPIFFWLRPWFNDLKSVLVVILLQGLVFLSIYVGLARAPETWVLSVLRTAGWPLFAYWFVYMALGAYLWRNCHLVFKISARISLKWKLVALGLSYLFLAIEYGFLFVISKGVIPPFDYAMLSSMVSVLVMFLCFASVEYNQIPKLLRQVIQLLSKYSLGIFCINGILSQVLLSLGSRLFVGTTFSFIEVLAIKFVGWSILLICSLGLSILLDRIRLGACVR